MDELLNLKKCTDQLYMCLFYFLFLIVQVIWEGAVLLNIALIKIKKNLRCLQRTSWAFNLVVGSRCNILRTKSLALSEILGHGSDSKSNFPFRISLNIPASVSECQRIRGKEIKGLI
jgi:hypothetical protein